MRPWSGEGTMYILKSEGGLSTGERKLTQQMTQQRKYGD